MTKRTSHSQNYLYLIHSHPLQQWYSSLWDRFDDWLRERIEARLKPEQLEWLSTLLEVNQFVNTVCAFMCLFVCVCGGGGKTEEGKSLCLDLVIH